MHLHCKYALAGDECAEGLSDGPPKGAKGGTCAIAAHPPLTDELPSLFC